MAWLTELSALATQVLPSPAWSFIPVWLLASSAPAIASVFPGPEGFFTVLDIGANVECKPIHLAQYAILGETYTKVVLGIKSPRIGLLNIGEEDDKGNELARATRKMLASMPINFVGNIEGSDLFFDKADVVVCDGFVGNIVLKTCEGMAKSLIGSLKMSLNKTTIRKAGAWLSKNAFVELKEILDHEEYGGAPLMGNQWHLHHCPWLLLPAGHMQCYPYLNGYGQLRIQPIDR